MNKDKRFNFGVLLTIGWLGYMLWQMATGDMPTKLNERGDFFAGFFAPLAFLWLVLGYLQQGEELRQSSEALRLQADELRNSVEQQSHLVEASRKQNELAAAIHDEDRKARHRNAQPKFSFKVACLDDQGSFMLCNLTLRNHGKVAREVLITQSDAEGGDIELGHFPSVDRGEEKSMNAQAYREFTATVYVQYTDEFGSLETVVYDLDLVGDDVGIAAQLDE